MEMIAKLNIPRQVLFVAIPFMVMVLPFFLPGTTGANPGDLYVSPAGISLDCTQADPCDLATAIQKAMDTDTIYLAGGVYHSSGDAVVSITRDVSLYGGWDGSPIGAAQRDPSLYKSILDGQQARRVVVISSGAAPVLMDLVITNGYGDYSGGGVHSAASHPTIQGCTIQDNHADGDGGGIFINGGSALIVNNRIISNSGNWAGGMRIINNAQVVVEGNLVWGNTANNTGGGIDIDCCGGTVAKVERNFISGNSAGTAGGGMVIASTNARLVNNILSGNTAPEGAGIYLDGMEGYLVDVDLINNTLSGLTSNDHAIYLNEYTTASLINNILAKFTTGIHDNDPLSNVLNADFNLFYNASDPIVGTNVVLADPLLDAGYHLTWGSPAIDAGSVVENSIDIDGEARPNGSFDLGADEYYPSLYLPLLISNGSGMMP